MASDDNSRERFEAKVGDLVGRRVQAVDYWDIHNFGPEPSRWDYEDWHHAVMGVQLATDIGPFTITWTNTFFPYGVEVFPDLIDKHLMLGEAGPERIGPDQESRWAALLGSSIRGAVSLWDRLELGPSTLADGTVVDAARDVDWPCALRLDFDEGPVWFVAAIPQWPEMKEVFMPGDEIMVVFSLEKMTAMGFTEQMALR